MTQSNAAIKSNVTIIPPRPDNLHEAIDMLHTSQITGDYTYSAMALAGPLMADVSRIFPLHMILIYLTTSYKRRQVWNAYIAAMYANPENPQPITNPDATRAKLLNTSSKELLQEAYGAIPGFQNALERLGLEGQEPRIYLLMHQFISENKNLQKALSHTSKIKASTIITLAALPKQLQNYDLAKQIKTPEDITTLLFMIKTLAQDDDAKYAEICSNVANAAKQGHSVSAVLKREYYNTEFPKQVVPDSEHCRYISSAVELKKAAIQFSNCLKTYVPESLRNEAQHYRWYENNRPMAVISLREDAPYGWRVFELLGKENMPLDDDLELKIITHFEKHGIFKFASLEALLRELGYLGVLNSGGRRDPVGPIYDVIDELLED